MDFTCKEAYKTEIENKCPVFEAEGEGEGGENRGGGGEYYKG